MFVSVYKKWQRFLALFSMVIISIFMVTSSLVPVTTFAASTATTTVIVHYHRFDNSYSGWNLWLWPQAPKSLGGAAYNFNGSDSFGQVATVKVPGDNTQVGVIVRQGNWIAKDIASNRYLNVTHGTAEVWLLQGNPDVYYSLADAQKAMVPAISSAFLDGAKIVTASFNAPVTIGKSMFTVKDDTTGTSIPVTNVASLETMTATVAGDFQTQLGASSNWDPSSSMTLMHQVNPDLYQFTATLKAGSYSYKIALNGSWSSAYPSQNVSLKIPSGGARVTISYIPSTEGVYDSINNPNQVFPTSSDGLKTSIVSLTLQSAPNVKDSLRLTASGYTALSITPRNVLNLPAYYYAKNNLGNTWTKRATTFRVWAPTATEVDVQLFSSATGPSENEVVMIPGPNGTFSATVPGNLNGWYYLYRVTIDGQTKSAVDPYATAISPDATRAMIVNLAQTNPAGWNRDHFTGVSNPVNAVIYEVGVRDFSVDKSGGFKYPGKYLAFTERNTHGPNHVVTGIASLKQLGVNYVQIMPIQEFLDPGYSYNWGYITRQFDTPEGMYATTPLGTARITQVKQMVQSLHQENIGVIMDVVYNHTYAISGSGFNRLVPGYFWRTDNQGDFYNGSGVGNEVAAQRPMVRKFIIDSLKYWVKEYHVNGFRFDLMALLGVNTMKEVSRQLHAIDPNIILYGEPWTGGTSGLNASQLLTKGQQQGLGIGVFNDNIRNAIEGNVFQVTQPGFAMGGTGYTAAIKNGVVGSVYYNAQIQDFAAAPSETINYVTSHDNYTLWDKLKQSNPMTPKSVRIQMDELAQAIVMTSQGVPFMQGGEEMLRTKDGNGNSYNAGDAINAFNWVRKAKYMNVFTYYSGLIHLRDDHPAFRMTTAAQIRKHLMFLTSPSDTVEFELTDYANGDHWKNIIVIYNPNTPQSFTLPSGRWNVVATANRIGEHPLEKVSGSVLVPNVTAEILYQS